MIPCKDCLTLGICKGMPLIQTMEKCQLLVVYIAGDVRQVYKAKKILIPNWSGSILSIEDIARTVAGYSLRFSGLKR